MIAVVGNSWINLSNLKIAIKDIKTPPKITEQKAISTPSPLLVLSTGDFIKLAIIAEKAPVNPFIIAGLPPKIPQITPIIHAECNANAGSIFATKPKATDSGIYTKQIIIPSNISFL